MAVRRMFHVCKLVHADLSEYNILYHEEHLWIIDVSQSVEHDHPAAFDFLRNDIKNMEDFFGRLGVRCLGLRRCFDFVTKAKLCEDDGTSDEDVLKRWLEEETTDICEDESGKGINLEGTTHGIDPKPQKSEDAQHEDSVFLRSFIPRTLNEVYDPERDVEKVRRGDTDGLIYAETIGLVSQSSRIDPDVKQTTKNKDSGDRPTAIKVKDGETEEEQADYTGDETDSASMEDNDLEDEEEEGKPTEGFVERKPRGHRHEDKESKKVIFTKKESLFLCSCFINIGAQKIGESRGEGKTQTEDAKGGEEAYHEENKILIAVNWKSNLEKLERP
jgi:RIO kinase 1